MAKSLTQSCMHTVDKLIEGIAAGPARPFATSWDVFWHASWCHQAALQLV